MEGKGREWRERGRGREGEEGDGCPFEFLNTPLEMLLFCSQTLDGDVYERMQEYFTLFCQSELHSCGVTQELFMKILSDATKVSGQPSVGMRHTIVIEYFLVFISCKSEHQGQGL